MDFTSGMQYLIVGHKSGAFAIWDLLTYKLLKIITDIHESEIVACKIYSLNDDGSIMGVVSMEVKGPVFHTEFNLQRFIVGMSYTKNVLF